MSDGRRIRRVEESVRAHLAQTLIRDIGDQRLAGLVITDVQLSADLGTARVGVRLLADNGSEAVRRDVLHALSRAAGRLRRGLGSQLRMKKTPDLRFHYDAGHEAERRVGELLDEIAHERGAREEGDSEERPSEPPESGEQS